jgi:hypothetical protein
MEALQSRAETNRKQRSLEGEERAAPLEAAVSRALHVLSQVRGLISVVEGT